MARTLSAAMAVLLLVLSPTQVVAQVAAENFAGRQAIIINNAPTYLTLSDFSFENKYYNSNTRLMTNLKWINSGTIAITAFEVVTLYFDPFNRPMTNGGRWLVTGHDSGNWAPLGPGEAGGDGLIGFQDEEALTGIVYVRAIRFENGTVWYSNQVEVEAKIKAAMPELHELGALDPGPKKTDH